MPSTPTFRRVNLGTGSSRVDTVLTRIQDAITDTVAQATQLMAFSATSGTGAVDVTCTGLAAGDCILSVVATDTNESVAASYGGVADTSNRLPQKATPTSAGRPLKVVVWRP